MRSRVGSGFLTVSAVIEFVIAFFAFVASLVALAFGAYTIVGIPLGLFGFLVLIVTSLFFLVVGLIYVWTSHQMLRYDRVVLGSVWAIIFGIITSWSIAGLFAIIGGIVGLIDSAR